MRGSVSVSFGFALEEKASFLGSSFNQLKRVLLSISNKQFLTSWGLSWEPPVFSLWKRSYFAVSSLSFSTMLVEIFERLIVNCNSFDNDFPGSVSCVHCISCSAGKYFVFWSDKGLTMFSSSSLSIPRNWKIVDKRCSPSITYQTPSGLWLTKTAGSGMPSKMDSIKAVFCSSDQR